eukprot:13759441-Alexandrium_andersonii.AAC.1
MIQAHGQKSAVGSLVPHGSTVCPICLKHWWKRQRLIQHLQSNCDCSSRIDELAPADFCSGPPPPSGAEAQLMPAISVFEALGSARHPRDESALSAVSLLSPPPLHGFTRVTLGSACAKRLQGLPAC